MLGSIGVAAYLVYWRPPWPQGGAGDRAQRRAFALVALAAAVMAVGGLGESLTGPAATGGFAAAGAILLALAVIASGRNRGAALPARLPRRTAAGSAGARRNREAPIDHNAPFNSLARAAIGAAHQGVFDLDFRAELFTLSPEAAADGGPVARMKPRCRMATGWRISIPRIARSISKALEEYRHRPGLAFRLEFRARGAQRPYRWLELRATIVSEQDVPSDCLGLISDITQRKEAESPAAGGSRTKRDAACRATR